ncbi:hypothetical protein Goshw_011407 [Gossypium schwendimanii]|uniref:Cytochrome P450 n=1 Tax=Gossypium schwendimanii TaxID=34291 RepID=A0A7J9MY91_GOSSC|nr:hypothetical protein [Gossypium schwendimanii]
MHPVVSLLIPRESSKSCVVNGFEIPAKTRVIVNAWEIRRDPNYWVEPEKFKPERKEICPGILFALPNVELPLAQLLFHFHWKLPGEMKQEDMDMIEMFGVSMKRKNDLVLVPDLVLVLSPYHASIAIA